MDQEIQKRFEEFDARLKVGERRAIPSLVDTQMRLDSLIDSDARLYGRMEELAEAQKKTEQSLRELAEAQKLTDAALRRFLERGGNGHV